MITYNITRWDGARFGPFATMDEAKDAAPGILAEWRKPGDVIQFRSGANTTVAGLWCPAVSSCGRGYRKGEGLTINKYAEPPPVEYEYFVVGEYGDDTQPWANEGTAHGEADRMFRRWLGGEGSDCTGGDRSETFSVYIKRKVKPCPKPTE